MTLSDTVKDPGLIDDCARNTAAIRTFTKEKQTTEPRLGMRTAFPGGFPRIVCNQLGSQMRVSVDDYDYNCLLRVLRNWIDPNWI